MLEKYIELKIGILDAVLKEREKAVENLAKQEAQNAAASIAKEYVLRETHTRDIKTLQEQISGPLGMELRMRALEQSKGVVDAKMYMILIGIPLAVSGLMYILMNHLPKM
ncbi:hypothetical protein [Candidatus Magnetobacterium casense]|uniref:Uncharacterized protein n=1 Tax=Candidatus Magnetobacterium casense TaxID=1455061 RepID=A0ABS6S491_9BACT|nr:hypothetical protein [Candidatus Magnetobacterium casensis]MBV6343667.1 hypothetical protein [Candidatus Magnetobacterium casensis]